ncbi:MAG: helix-turn-helix domain-containing protein [Pseudobutyrivibrio ruminis]|nr:helix-turn-helix domain-containing protein [Pseudobutyrivibrio ruminis]
MITCYYKQKAFLYIEVCVMDFFSLERIASLLRVSIMVCDVKGEISFKSKIGANPLMTSFNALKQIISMAKVQELPLIYRDDFGICYGLIHKKDNICIIGPISTEHMDKISLHKYYQLFNVNQAEELTLTMLNEGEILDLVALVSKVYAGKEYTAEQLVKANKELFSAVDISSKELEQFSIESDEEDIYRHTYQDERQLLDLVREGNVKEALERTREMDGDIGKLSKNDLDHWKNLMVVATTLCARAAIEGGVAPYVAYRVSGFYINKGTSCDDVFKVITLRNQAVEELTRLVSEQKNRRHTSSYTEQCKDYVKKHYREKIYLDEIAAALKISDSYLSRTFKKDTGLRLQDYIVQVRLERAANLLLYSNESIPRIAEYVNFPSQSYLGKVFKEKYGLTPRQYREKYKPVEFLSLEEREKDEVDMD